MGCCFLPCFCSSKHRKSRKKQAIIHSGDHQGYGTSQTPLQPTKPTKQEVKKNTEPIITDSKKKVTFDLNVKTYEESSAQKIQNCSVECEKGKEKERENKEETQNERQSLSDSSMSSVFSYPPSHRYHNFTTIDDDQSEDMELVETTDSDDINDHDALAQEQDSSESLFSLSIGSRKQVSASEIDEKEVNSPITIPVTTGSNQISRESALNPIGNLTRWKADKAKRAVTPLKDREKENINLEQEISIPFSEEPSLKSSDSRESVLNPIENLSQWKAAKAKRAFTPLKGQEKENIDSEQELSIPLSEEPSFKSSKHGSQRRSNRAKQEFNEIAVDTSLSSWLVESETTPMTKSSPFNSVGNSPDRANSSRCNEDRPILGALTVEDLKKLSASSSPRRSPSRSPDEIPIIGTVGSYWKHTGQGIGSDSGSSRKGMPSTTSKYREKNKRVKWHSTLETRLEEGALDRGIAQV
ncbi:unnamed protein product [Camellia sinensis]